MIAQKIRPGIILISKQEMRNNIESYTMLDISEEDAVELLFTSENVTKTNNGFEITYNESDLVNRMFKAIASRHSQSNPNFADVSKKYRVDDDYISGTSLLLRDPKKQIIKVCRRSTTNSNVCNINRLFVPNKYRDKFFKDVVYGSRFQETGKYELDSRDYDLYSWWSDFMNTAYFGILEDLKKEKCNI